MLVRIRQLAKSTGEKRQRLIASREDGGEGREQIGGLSEGDLPMRTGREDGRLLMDQIGERELHFNGPSAYVKAFCGFHEGKNPRQQSSARRASKTVGVFANEPRAECQDHRVGRISA